MKIKVLLRFLHIIFSNYQCCTFYTIYDNNNDSSLVSGCGGGDDAGDDDDDAGDDDVGDDAGGDGFGDGGGDGGDGFGDDAGPSCSCTAPLCGFSATSSLIFLFISTNSCGSTNLTCAR